MIEFIHKVKKIIAIHCLAIFVLNPFNTNAQACMGFTVEGVQVYEDGHGEVQISFDVHTENQGEQLFVNAELSESTNIIITSQFSLVEEINNDGSFQFIAQGEFIDAIIGLPDDLELSGIIFIGTIGDDLVCELPFEGIAADEIVYIDNTSDDLFPSYDVCGQLTSNAWIDGLENNFPMLHVNVFGGSAVAAIDNESYIIDFPTDFQQYFINGVDVDINQFNPETLNFQFTSFDMEALNDLENFEFSISVNVNEDVFCEVPVTVEMPEAIGLVSGTIINTDDVFESNKVFPNPADVETTIDLSDFNQIQTAVTVIDIIGQTVIELDTDQEVTTIDVSTLAPGMYILKINNDIINKTAKLMIE